MVRLRGFKLRLVGEKHLVIDRSCGIDVLTRRQGLNGCLEFIDPKIDGVGSLSQLELLGRAFFGVRLSEISDFLKL